MDDIETLEFFVERGQAIVEAQVFVHGEGVMRVTSPKAMRRLVAAAARRERRQRRNAAFLRQTGPMMQAALAEDRRRTEEGLPSLHPIPHAWFASRRKEIDP